MFTAKMNPMHSILVMIFSNLHPRPIVSSTYYFFTLESPEKGSLNFDSVIYFPIVLLEPAELKQDIAHELFHVIQNQYMACYSIGIRL